MQPFHHAFAHAIYPLLVKRLLNWIISNIKQDFEALLGERLKQMSRLK